MLVDQTAVVCMNKIECVFVLLWSALGLCFVLLIDGGSIFVALSIMERPTRPMSVNPPIS